MPVPTEFHSGLIVFINLTLQLILTQRRRNPLSTLKYLLPIYPAAVRWGFVATKFLVKKTCAELACFLFWMSLAIVATPRSIIAPNFCLFNSRRFYKKLESIQNEDHKQQTRKELHSKEGAVPQIWHRGASP